MGKTKEAGGSKVCREPRAVVSVFSPIQFNLVQFNAITFNNFLFNSIHFHSVQLHLILFFSFQFNSVTFNSFCFFSFFPLFFSFQFNSFISIIYNQTCFMMLYKGRNPDSKPPPFNRKKPRAGPGLQAGVVLLKTSQVRTRRR